MTKANPGPNVGEFSLMCPFLELMGAEAAEKPSRIGPIVTHLPMSVFQPVKHAKYVYVARNPYDCAVSYYHFLKGSTPKTITDVSFERFLSMFLNGKVIYGDYFDHVMPWYDRRHEDNVLFITYEQLKADTGEQVLRIADFLGKEHGTALRQDDSLLEKILDASSFENMKIFFKEKPGERVKKIIETAGEKSERVEILMNFPKEQVEMHDGSGFVRKGIVGDWKNYFTPEQVERTKAWIARKTAGSDVMTLWQDCDLP
ncbi:hypothetical protein V5799_033070 [Amblyomma americanum]|uniref:Sulfotransferase domain-containing protein n=1 Tax=Amblyomma americanum TaxID=6943 RepID=A0AAQ4DPC9_AMBAM